jgi:hypothetical protein
MGLLTGYAFRSLVCTLHQVGRARSVDHPKAELGGSVCCGNYEQFGRSGALLTLVFLFLHRSQATQRPFRASGWGWERLGGCR